MVLNIKQRATVSHQNHRSPPHLPPPKKDFKQRSFLPPSLRHRRFASNSNRLAPSRGAGCKVTPCFRARAGPQGGGSGGREGGRVRDKGASAKMSQMVRARGRAGRKTAPIGVWKDVGRRRVHRFRILGTLRDYAKRMG